LRADVIKRQARQYLGGEEINTVEEMFAAWVKFIEAVREEKAEEERKAALQAAKLAAQAHKEGRACTPGSRAKLARQMTNMSRCSLSRADTKRIGALDANGEPPNGQWRKLEDLRRNAKHRVKCWGISFGICFEYWKHYARERGADMGRPRPVPEAMKTIGSNLISAGSGDQILAELTLVETLYESRIGAAERLLASFVMFHQAVKPLSRLPGWKYDLDRSESRLRVASTPAPVGFVETLPRKQHHEAQKVHCSI